ncbi:hypothetical protein [Pedobacter miscanthi]|uniref:hypothetical protein n=1 Tax=Pedobacter miscanthi TaxID=2259170 RepID=UPI001ABFB934|nr:hypothetical protein [Pedobacter miscanthi]
MKNDLAKAILLSSLALMLSCKQAKKNQSAVDKPAQHTSSNNINHVASINSTNKLEPGNFVPKGYVLAEQINGDLNGDGLADCVLMVKNTLKNRIVKDPDRGILDRNRRGLIVLLNKKDHYEPVVKNLSCFSSENEDGGVYYAPELMVSIEKGKLYIHYAHGRYGYWKYTFRYGKNDFELIGYDASNNTGPRVDREVSINFLTKRRLEKNNTNEQASGGDEVFEEKWTDISLEGLAKLSEVKDFDDFGEGGW